MLIANCPHCNDPIRIPGAANASSRVRCPWCEETYLLADVFEHLPPLVEVLEGPGSQGEISVDSDGDEYQLAGVAAAPDFNFKESESTGSSSPAPMARVEGRSTASGRRPAKNGSNPAWEAFKVVGGGVFGIVIAMFAVMWISGDDKFHIVQFIPSFAYFAVPENLWTEDMKTAAGSKAEESPGETEKPTKIEEPVKAEKVQEEPAAANDGQVKNAVDEGMSSLSAAFNEAKNRSEKPAPDLGKPEFEPPPEPPVVVKPSPKVDAAISAELAKVTAEIGPIGAELPSKEEPEPPARREPNVSLAPEGK
ncbi:hypothetical protein LOC68_12045 [Blastopirellula sp. JC732]|uniref:Uncharacterized protein n=1 Tax=Blastopirellula sediminis TaxID=2894196 RepID=A0A9X1MMV6_9BACT|nr:hypothetical protein [Blastopirellula sediminis]MCC9607577.1 hypothetical protein [Blastopirellula sediminis]MCC9629130.1 hypothetical protein [Blastopirellula sediminis]